MSIVYRRAAIGAISDRARVLLFSGAVVSLLGYTPKWFDSNGDGFGGWQTTFTAKIWWVGIPYVGYAILIIGGFFLLGRGLGSATLVSLVAIATALLALLPVILTAGFNTYVGVEKIPFSLIVMLLGHTLMLGGATAAWLMQALLTIFERDEA